MFAWFSPQSVGQLWKQHDSHKIEQLHHLLKTTGFCMVSIICKSSFAKTVLQFFLQIKTLVEIERQGCYANWWSNCSNTSSEISFHGLPSKSKCPSIRKLIVVIITVNSIIVFTKQPSTERYFSKHILPVFSWTCRKFLQQIKKAFQKFVESSQKNIHGKVLFQ